MKFGQVGGDDRVESGVAASDALGYPAELPVPAAWLAEEPELRVAARERTERVADLVVCLRLSARAVAVSHALQARSETSSCASGTRGSTS
jgi:hypothetical protein